MRLALEITLAHRFGAAHASLKSKRGAFSNSMHKRQARAATQLTFRVSSLTTITLMAIVAGVPFCGKTSVGSVSAQQQTRPSALRPDQSARSHSASAGKSLFATNCSGCHGLDGQGSERAPGIARSAKEQRLSDEQLAKIVSNGVPGTGMPAFRALGNDRLREVVKYLRALQGKHGPRSLPGDAARGKEIFFGKGECSTCHMIDGAGGFLGPDLSAFGPGTAAQTILDAIVSADRVVPAGYRLAVVTSRDGNRFEGIVRNEDNFSLQLQARDGSFHFFKKSELESVEYPTQPLMPTNYRQRLSSGELNDLVNYLVNGGNSQKAVRVPLDDNNDEQDFQ